MRCGKALRLALLFVVALLLNLAWTATAARNRRPPWAGGRRYPGCIKAELDEAQGLDEVDLDDGIDLDDYPDLDDIIDLDILDDLDDLDDLVTWSDLLEPETGPR